MSNCELRIKGTQAEGHYTEVRCPGIHNCLKTNSTITTSFRPDQSYSLGPCGLPEAEKKSPHQKTFNQIATNGDFFLWDCVD